MIKNYFSVLFILCVSQLSLAAKPAETKEETLCKDKEKVIFSCSRKKAIISVCASESVKASDRFVQYREGTKDKVDEVFPASGVGGIKYARIMLAGGGGSALVFTKDTEKYIVYSKITNHGESAGAQIQNNGKVISQMNCKKIGQFTNFGFDSVSAYGITEVDDSELID